MGDFIVVGCVAACTSGAASCSSTVILIIRSLKLLIASSVRVTLLVTP